MQKQNTTTRPIEKRSGRPPVINPLSPCCLTCRGFLSTSGIKGSRWQCRKVCGTSIYKQTSGELRENSEAFKSHPCCVKCRRVMARHSKGYWRCLPCKAYTKDHELKKRIRRVLGVRSGSLGIDRPYCVQCHKLMSSYSTNASRWRCRPCKWGVDKRTSGVPRGYVQTYPYCGQCHGKMRTHNKGWYCHRCDVIAKDDQQRARYAKPKQKENNDDLITFIDSKLTNYSVEMREELRGEVAIALLTHANIGGQRVTRDSLTPAAIRLIAKPIYRMQPNRFRDVSLDHQYGEDGQRLEDRLVG
jgi:hypothetical protein